MKPLNAVKSSGFHDLRGEGGKTAIVILMALVFGNIAYLTLSAFLVYHQDEVWSIHRLQEDLKAKHQFRRAVDCHLPCAMNQMALKKHLDKTEYTISCFQRSPYLIKISKEKTPDLLLCPNLAKLPAQELQNRRLSQSFQQHCPESSKAVGIDFASKRLICNGYSQKIKVGH